MPIALMCPNLQCRTLLRVPEGTRGKKVRCPECGGVLIVPRTKPTEAAAVRGSTPEAAKPD